MKPLYIVVIILSCLFLGSCSSIEQEARDAYEEGKELSTDDAKLNEAAEALLHSLSLQDESIPTVLLASTYEYISRVYWEQDYTQKALTYALKGMECCNKLNNDSLRSHMLNRIASCYYLDGKNAAAIHYYTQTKDLAIKLQDTAMIKNALNNIGAVLLSEKKYDEAIKMFDESIKYSKNNKKDSFKYHYNLSRCYKAMNKWEESSKEIRLAMRDGDRNDVEAFQKLYRRLYESEKYLGHTEYAYVCADSSYLLADSIFYIKKREELKDITERHQQEQHEAEMKLQRTHWMFAVVCIIFAALGIIAGIMYRNKKRILKLQQRMDSIKVRIARKTETQAPTDDTLQESTEDEHVSNNTQEQKEQDQSSLIPLYAEQFQLARELFRSRPAHNKLRQLKYHTDKNYLSDDVRLPIIDSVTEVFIDPMQGLRTLYPELTADECLYAVLSFLGCSNAIISILTKTTEATLRKRRSRFKQKTNEQVFSMLMEG